MFPLIVFISALIHPSLAAGLAAPMAVMALLAYAPSLVFWTRRGSESDDGAVKLENPLELNAALRFGAFLAAVMLLGKLLAQSFGDQGVLWLAAISGVADLNAITLSVGRMSQQDLALTVAVLAITIAAATNGLVKTAVSAVVGGRAIGLHVGLPLVTGSLAGLAVAWMATPLW